MKRSSFYFFLPVALHWLWYKSCLHLWLKLRSVFWICIMFSSASIAAPPKMWSTCHSRHVWSSVFLLCSSIASGREDKRYSELSELRCVNRLDMFLSNLTPAVGWWHRIPYFVLLWDKKEYVLLNSRYILVTCCSVLALSATEASFHEGGGQSLHRVCEQFGGKVSTPGFLIFSFPLPGFLLWEGATQSQVSQVYVSSITRLFPGSLIFFFFFLNVLICRTLRAPPEHGKIFTARRSLLEWVV